MSGPIPASVRAKMLPAPQNWNPPIHEDDDRIWWRGIVTTSIGQRVSQLPVEYGFSKRNGPDRSVVKAVAWEITELARLGRLDLIGYARVDRHKGRPVAKPEITAENMQQATVKTMPDTTA